MYKIIIVEDKEITREGLRQFIDWNSLQSEVAACFENGNSAMEYLDHNPADIVLTDIEMDYGNGIDLSRFIHERFPEIKIIMITAFANFEYAKKAIEFGVFAYVLKPIDEDEVTEKVAGAISEIEKDRGQKQLIDNLTRQQASKNLQEYLDGAEGKIGLLKKFFSQTGEPCAYAAVSLKSRDKSHISSADCIPVFQKYFRDAYAARLNGFLTCIVLMEPGKGISRDVMEAIRLELYRKSRICVGEVVGTVEELPHSLRTSYEAYNMSFLKDGKGVVFYSDVLTDTPQKPDHGTYLEYSHLKNLIFKNREEECRAYIENVFLTYRYNGIDQKHILNQCREALTYLCNIVNDYLLYKSIITIDYTEMMDAPDLSRVQAFFQQQVQRLSGQILKKQKEVIRPIVKLAFEYSVKHVEDVSLNLKAIAEHLNISYAYLSKAFKEDFGKSYTEYMNRYRIELAKKHLLASDEKIQEICDRIGLEPKNFYYLFKKYENMTPREFKAINSTKG